MNRITVSEDKSEGLETSIGEIPRAKHFRERTCPCHGSPTSRQRSMSTSNNIHREWVLFEHMVKPKGPRLCCNSLTTHIYSKMRLSNLRRWGDALCPYTVNIEIVIVISVSFGGGFHPTAFTMQPPSSAGFCNTDPSIPKSIDSPGSRETVLCTSQISIRQLTETTHKRQNVTYLASNQGG